MAVGPPPRPENESKAVGKLCVLIGVRILPQMFGITISSSIYVFDDRCPQHDVLNVPGGPSTAMTGPSKVGTAACPRVRSTLRLIMVHKIGPTGLISKVT